MSGEFQCVWFGFFPLCLVLLFLLQVLNSCRPLCSQEMCGNNTCTKILQVIVSALLRDKRAPIIQLLSTFPLSQCVVINTKEKGGKLGASWFIGIIILCVFLNIRFLLNTKTLCRLCSNYLVFYQRTQNTSLTLSVSAIVVKKMKIHLCK